MMNMTKGFANQSVDMNETLYAVDSTGIPRIPHKKNSIGKTQRNKIELHFRMIGEYIMSCTSNAILGVRNLHVYSSKAI
jgi:hypothetical protein